MVDSKSASALLVELLRRFRFKRWKIAPPQAFPITLGPFECRFYKAGLASPTWFADDKRHKADIRPNLRGVDSTVLVVVLPCRERLFRKLVLKAAQPNTVHACTKPRDGRDFAVTYTSPVTNSHKSTRESRDLPRLYADENHAFKCAVFADHRRPLSFLGTGTYGLLNGTAGRFQTGVVVILLLSRTVFFPPPLELLLPPDPALVVSEEALLTPLGGRVGGTDRGFRSPPLPTAASPHPFLCGESRRCRRRPTLGLTGKSSRESTSTVLGKLAAPAPGYGLVSVCRGGVSGCWFDPEASGSMPSRTAGVLPPLLLLLRVSVCTSSISWAGLESALPQVFRFPLPPPPLLGAEEDALAGPLSPPTVSEIDWLGRRDEEGGGRGLRMVTEIR